MMLLRLLLFIMIFSFYGTAPSFAQNEGIVDVPPLPPADPPQAPLPDLNSPQPAPTQTPDEEAPPPFPTLPPTEVPAPQPVAEAPPSAAEPPAPAPATPSSTVSNLLKESVEGEKDGFEPSYGNREHSLFFSKNDSDNIRHILRLYESGSLDKAAPDAGIAELLQDLQPKDEQKQLVYPRFKLRSVIYRSPAEWVVLLNENRISSYNNSADREVTVLNVSKSTVSFRWKPTDEMLLAAIGRDAAMRGQGGTATNNRIAKGARTSFDTAAKTIFFTLSVNQDFDSQTFEITEGGMLNKKPADAAATAAAVTAPTAAAPAGATTPPGQAAQDSSRPSMRPGIPNVSAPSSTTQSGNALAAPSAAPSAPAAAPTPSSAPTAPAATPPAASTAPSPAAQPAATPPAAAEESDAADREALPQSAILKSLGLE